MHIIINIIILLSIQEQGNTWQRKNKYMNQMHLINNDQYNIMMNDEVIACLCIHNFTLLVSSWKYVLH